MSSFLHEMEEMCSRSLKKPGDKSHKADHKCGRSHLVHKSFLIFTSGVQRVLSWLHCAAMPRHSACRWCGCACLANTSRAAKPSLRRAVNALWWVGTTGTQDSLLWVFSATSGFPLARSQGTQTPTDLCCICETFHTHTVHQCSVSSSSLLWT